MVWGTSGSIVKLDLLSFRILAQVEVMASRLCGVSILSFDFTKERDVAPW